MASRRSRKRQKKSQESAKNESESQNPKPTAKAGDNDDETKELDPSSTQPQHQEDVRKVTEEEVDDNLEEEEVIDDSEEVDDEEEPGEEESVEEEGENLIEEEAEEVDEESKEEGKEDESGKDNKTSTEQQKQEVSLTSSSSFVSDGRYRNKQRCLVVCSRGVTARYRHLLEDLRTLMPHHKKESKLDPGTEGVGRAVNAICEIRSCNTVLFLECRKRLDAFLWMGRSGTGPSARFHVSNIHTMDELRLTGNCMKSSRPILSFDESFTGIPHLAVLKELFTDIFGTPRGHPKSKPFVDRVMAFYFADNKIWVRNYQILEEHAKNAKEAHQAKKLSGKSAATSLVEIGPRFVLNPIRIFRGSFGGQTLFLNPHYVSPNEVRALERRDKGNAYEERKRSQEKRKARKRKLVLPEDPLDSVFY